MSCIETMDYEILLSRVSFKECREFVEKNFKEIHRVKPGYKLFDIYLIGVPPVLIGIDDDHIIFPYTKPCHGTFLLRMESKEEIDKLRSIS
jgi:hypothetical protein